MTMFPPLRLRFLLAAGLAGGAFALGTAGSSGVAQATGRPGVTISYAQIGGQARTTGVDGRAYLPTTPAWVTVDTGPRSCANGRRTELVARARTGQVREFRIMVNATGPGTVTLGAAGCPGGSISATLDDGTVLEDETGTITITEFGSATNPTLSASFSWSPTLNGHPIPFRGLVVAPAPSAP